MVTAFSCGAQTMGPEVALTIDGAPPPGPRVAESGAGQRLPFRSQDGAVVAQLASRTPRPAAAVVPRSTVATTGSCSRRFEGSRAIDNRYGLNWKRGGVGDLSQDIVNYNYGADSDEGTKNVYIVDIMGGHCGGNPGPFWQDQTEATARRHDRQLDPAAVHVRRASRSSRTSRGNNVKIMGPPVEVAP